MSLLTKSVRDQSRADQVALLLSSGIDSLSVGLALQAEGKSIHAYTFEIQGYPSRERRRVEWIARHFGWKLTVVTIPTTAVRDDFTDLAVRHRCRKKVQFEVLWPLLYVLPQVEEKEVWTGWNADDHYGNTKKVILVQSGLRRDGIAPDQRKREFDDSRVRRREEFNVSGSADTWWFAKRLAEHYGKHLYDPYVEERVFRYFLQFDHDQLSPPDKPLVRQALAEELGGLLPNRLGRRVPMQKGLSVDVLFKALLPDPLVNRFEPKAKSVSALCQRWGREVAACPDSFQSELEALPSRPAAPTRLADDGAYTPYLMEDVRKGSSKALFKCVSAFAGGGGSSIGYRLAGGKVLGVIEFVPEAERTYRRNFPDTFVDGRDVREVLEDDAKGLLDRLGIWVGDLDILDGSPPCSEFSSAGTGIKDQTILRPYSDVQQSGIATLPFELMRLAHVLEPKALVCENVPALATRYPDVLENILSELRFSGDGERRYYAAVSVLAADEFGVPQARKRLFIIGVRKDVAEAVGIHEDADVRRCFPIATSSPVTIRSALRGLKQDVRQVGPWRKSFAVSSLGEIIRRFPKNPPKHLRPSDLNPADQSNFTFRRCSYDLPAPTLVVSGQRPNGLTGSIHPEFDRKFTIPELKRLFGLPDDYLVTGTLSQAAERICRMVPPFLTRAIAESIYTNILKPYAEVRK